MATKKKKSEKNPPVNNKSKTLNVFIIGAGRVGTFLVLKIQLKKNVPGTPHIKLTGLLDINEERLNEVNELIGLNSKALFTNIENAAKVISASDVILVAVPEKMIATVGKELKASGALNKETLVSHTAGSQAPSLLGLDQVCLTGLFHPLISVPTVELQGYYLMNEFFAGICGKEKSLRKLATIAQSFGWTPVEIPQKSLELYHAGAVLSANLLIVPAIMAGYIFAEKIGLPSNLAYAMATSLSKSIINNVDAKGFVYGLTGPLARGEFDVVRKQILSLQREAPEIMSLYSTLTHYLLTVMLLINFWKQKNKKEIEKEAKRLISELEKII